MSCTPVPAFAPRLVRTEVIDPADALSRAVAAARGGACVLLIQSTVADAIAVYRQIQAAEVPCLLHHSRYADADRLYLDATLIGIMGKHGNRGGLVAVTTQTAEQSLDIDADLLITDPVSADVLLQRIGRLHRHDRPRPGRCCTDRL